MSARGARRTPGHAGGSGSPHGGGDDAVRVRHLSAAPTRPSASDTAGSGRPRPARPGGGGSGGRARTCPGCTSHEPRLRPWPAAAPGAPFHRDVQHPAALLLPAEPRVQPSLDRREQRPGLRRPLSSVASSPNRSSPASAASTARSGPPPTRVASARPPAGDPARLRLQFRNDRRGRLPDVLRLRQGVVPRRRPTSVWPIRDVCRSSGY